MGFQAVILCGPGVSLTTFTSKEDSPKCLIPVANRPMVYYPLQFCKKAGITDITLITPPSAAAPLQAALQQNPYLTSLSSPSPSILAPADLEMTTGTAELLRLPEVQACIKSNFLLLPCDIICEIPGESLLEAWMVADDFTTQEPRHTYGLSSGPGAEQFRPRGGLSVFYQTEGREESVKGEPTDLVATAPLEQDEAPAVSHPLDGPAALRFGLSKLVMSMPMDTVKEKMEQDKGFLMRHSLVETHPQVKILTKYRDAHLYIFPYWIKALVREQEKFESVSEDLIGYWAKAEWQRGLGDKLGINKIFQKESHSNDDSGSHDGESLEDEIDLHSLSTTKAGLPKSATTVEVNSESSIYASRVKAQASKTKSEKVPPMLAYVQRSSAPFVRRVDSTATLLTTSLRLAKLESIEDVGRTVASPFAHNQKVAHPEGVAQRCTVTKSDCLLGQNTTVAEKCVIKESCIGSNVTIGSGARLTRCVVFDGAIISERATLTGCVIGRRSQIGRECSLKDCEVQDGNVVPEDTDAKNEKFMIFEGLDDEEDDMDDMSEDSYDS
ncbi:eukaryotic translation initiation factor subunit eIF2B-gamma [Penicillium taxi]|uniref:eukaryotic translation initiation factor subunit eIF2B-gamma n=1 Tax=Penicillium taxi TaxID=168475 RepID=UPI0025458204|nr:eukaryotic translation initiation factor subunit eIF2B-gamma [Penicillium taxi]KAJ5902881.1 eukaryotic translation initiation factor subunit eIF2B-gamma [Penicillium taxi]